MQAAWQAQAGNLPKFPSPSNGNLVDFLLEQGLPPAKAMSAGMGALKENVNKQEVEEEIKRQTEVAAVTEGLAQALAAEYPQTMLGAWGLPGIPDVAKEASKYFGTNSEEVKNKVRTIGYGGEIDAVTAAQVIESSWEGTAYEYKPSPVDEVVVVEEKEEKEEKAKDSLEMVTSITMRVGEKLHRRQSRWQKSDFARPLRMQPRKPLPKVLGVPCHQRCGSVSWT